MSSIHHFRLAAAAALLGAGLAASGCTTEAFCFSDCEAKSTESGSGTGTGTGGDGGGLTTGSGTGGDCFPNCQGGGGGSECVKTNGGVEICDGTDNDCNGDVDDVADLDLSHPKSCGTCDNNCFTTLTNCDPGSITCTPSNQEGTAGTCVCGECSQDYWDLDGDGACEYYCIKTSDDDATCNNKDDNCDGKKDEDVDVCTSSTDCGACGNNCVFPNGVGKCVHTGAMPCTTANTKCEIESCKCEPGDCWWDVDPTVAGCEYKCELTNGGVEICGDGIDNDCDGLIDEADDLSGDPQIGNVCFGGVNGVCAEAANSGLTACVGNQVVCAGANVVFPGMQVETCNSKDDDCDGEIDDSPVDEGAACGVSNLFPCSLGVMKCQGGALVCTGEVGPQPEVCNGQDTNCDGLIDGTAGNPPVAPTDSVGPCNIPPPPPPGATSPCMQGAKTCSGGAIICVGSVGPTSTVDTCGVDANCDGQLTNQPDTQKDVTNCGACGNNCYASAVHSIQACESGQCVFKGCETGWWDLNGNGECDYACNFVQAQEICNGTDDNCNGQIDENVIAPSPVQVCGVSPSASSPECTTGVSVTCDAGAWKCGFPAGVCSAPGGCAFTTEGCDGLDNNCNGLLNENVPNFGKACTSDHAAPNPGHGACQTTGTFVCNGADNLSCSAVKADCNVLPGGCTEVCDGIDNDCDGLIDEPFTAKGSDSTHFVKPAVTRISPTRWVYSFEASRPDASSAAPGNGNGFHTSAPSGETLDKTSACSVQNRIPWFNVTPNEAEQTCSAMGGFVCSLADWQTGCEATVPCKWGYNPRGGACNAPAVGAKFCNLSTTYDADLTVPGNQDVLLPTGSTSIMPNCFADWSSLQGNVAGSNRIFDITGNLREIAKRPDGIYAVMGGAFNTQSEEGATCQFSFYSVEETFKFFDTGFRCCFDADPRF